MSAPETVTHEQANELLPWVVSGSLEHDERNAILAHARFCTICRSELDTLGRLQRAIADDASTDPIPAPDMRRINRRIDALASRRGFGQRLAGAWHGLSANPWRTAFVAQALVLVAAVAVWLGREPAMTEYTTLTRTQQLPAGDSIRVAFGPALDAARIEELLGGLGLSVWSGPSQRGVYTLTVAPGSDREAVLTALRGNADVLFAEPVYRRADE